MIDILNLVVSNTFYDTVLMFVLLSGGEEPHPECWMLWDPQVCAGKPRFSHGGFRLFGNTHTQTQTQFSWDFPQMFFIMNVFSLFLLPAPLFPGHHSEPGFWRPVYGSERNFPRAYSKSRGQNWHFQKKQRLEKCLCANCLKEVWANCCSCMPEEIGKDVSLLQASRTFSSTDEPKEGCMRIWCLNEVSFLKQPWENFSLN